MLGKVMMIMAMMAIPHGAAGGGAALENATFAGGCFWCMEPPFEGLAGVERVTAGYTGGDQPDPKYEDVARGRTGHLEAVQIEYDPDRIGYDELLDVFWRQIDPTDAGGQFADRGGQYRTAVFFHTEAQRRAAEASKRALEASGRFDAPVATRILPAKPFYPAETYHQDYFRKNVLHYKSYREGSGRGPFLAAVWKDAPNTSPEPAYRKPDDATLRERLAPLQYRVTQEEATEPPFQNAYWDHHAEGLYVDVASGEPLFLSRDKFTSGTGWPSFTRPVHPNAVVEKEDRKLWSVRTEVRSRYGDSHLGHVFDDGPAPTGKRYCINSAALRFVPVQDLAKEGYGEYLAPLQSGARGGN